MELGLHGKSALVTGGSKGIGLAVAKGLAEEGCHLHLAARTESDLEKAANDIQAVHKVGVRIHPLDLSTPDNLRTLADACIDVNILVNNAGSIPAGNLTDLDDTVVRKAWELKLFGTVNLSRHLYTAMKERGHGVILNIIGAAAVNPKPNYIAGAVANVGLENFTKALGKESPAYGVRVVGIHPALTRTDRMNSLYESRAEKELGDRNRWRELLPALPFDRPTEPKEVANLAVFLASERASYTSGVVVSMSGGL